MKHKINAKLFVAIVFAFGIFFSCTKLDVAANEDGYETASEIEHKFFNNFKSSDSKTEGFKNYLYNLNAKHHFVERTVKQIGYPRWDKMIAKNSSDVGQSSIVQNVGDSTDIFYLPFVRPNENYVNASMIITTTASDTTLGYACDWQYRSLPRNNSSNNNDSSENFALSFMMFDKAVFAHSKFTIVDSTLFKQNNKRVKTLTINDAAQSNFTNNLISSACVTVTLTWVDCWGGNPNCTDASCQRFSSTITCTTLGGGDGGGNGGNQNLPPPPPTGNGGTSGSSGNTYNPPAPPCARTNPACMPGWQPLLFDSTNPCKVIDSLLKTNNFPLYLQDLRDRTNANHEFAYIFTNPLSPNTIYDTVRGPDSALSVTFDPAIPIGGAAHNHYNDPRKLGIFSADDIYQVYKLLVDNKIENLSIFTQSLVTDSTSYIAMITDSTAFRSFGNSVMFGGREGLKRLQLLIYKGYQIHEDSSVAKNEKNLLKAFGLFSSGLTLFRGNSNLTQFSRIVLDANGNTIVQPCIDY
jgi:hypothetical protein